MLRSVGRVLALALLLVAASPAGAADYTQSYPLTSSTTWTPIGTPPFDLQANGGDIEIFQADTTPSVVSKGQVLRNLAPAKTYTYAQPMYARLTGSSLSATAFTMPSTSGGSGGGGGDLIVTPSASFTRPANTTAYASAQTVANSTTAGSVVPLSWITGSNFYIRRVRMTSTARSTTNASFRVHFYSSSPTTASGDGAAWSTTTASLICDMDVSLTNVGTDVAWGTGIPNSGGECNVALAAGQTLYGVIEARAAYTPASGEVISVIPEVHISGASGSSSTAGDPNNASYQGAVQMTVGATALSKAVRAVAASCTGAGTLTLLMADGSSLYWDVSIGYQFQPFAATQIAASTATCSRYQGFN